MTMERADWLQATNRFRKTIHPHAHTRARNERTRHPRSTRAIRTTRMHQTTKMI
jgi:hypothetical protein